MQKKVNGIPIMLSFVLSNYFFDFCFLDVDENLPLQMVHVFEF